MNRRNFVKLGATATLGACATAGGAAVADGPAAARINPGGDASQPFRHSVTRWPWSRMSVPDLARTARGMGVASVELLEIEDWPVAKAAGVACAVGYAKAGDPRTRLTKGWNRAEHHAWLLPGYEDAVRLAGEAGVPTIICFSGNREGQSDAEGLRQCAAGLRQLMPAAERHGVTVIMELFNSKVDHPDYTCDSSHWGVDLVQAVGSPRFKLLYDIYHMQIMEGDVIRTIRDHHDAFAHYHVAGVPGRHEPDATQELNYAAIARALAEVGFAGYVAQEFIPTRDPIVAMREAVATCSVPA